MKNKNRLFAGITFAALSAAVSAQTPLNSLNGLLADPLNANLISLENLLAIPMDFSRSADSVGEAIPGLIAFGSNTNPIGALQAVTGIGGSLGVGAVTGIVPLTTILLDPSLAPTFFQNSGIISNFGFLGQFPAIPLLNTGFDAVSFDALNGLGLPGLGGLGVLDTLLGGGVDGLALPLGALSL